MTLPALVEQHPAKQLARIAFTQLTGEQVHRLVRLQKGWGHISWTVRTHSGRYLLKTGLRRPALADLYRQVAAQQQAAAHIPTPLVVAISDHGAALQRPCYVQTWLDGVDGEVLLPRLGPQGVQHFGRALGAAVAAMHQVPGPRFAEDCSGAVTYASWTDACHARLSRVTAANEKAAVLDTGVLSTVVDHLAERIGDLPRTITPRLTHRDLYLPNALQLAGANGAVGLIDWESAAFYDPVWDFVKLGMWVFDRHPELRAPFMDGYGPLPGAFDERLAVYQGIEYLAGFPYFGAAWPDATMLTGFRRLLNDWLATHCPTGTRS
ncbi:phosphotransferase family protein [Streptomyces luteireticuli]|uniref:phosphotransferase family protein n=1 Tax=Streptomyces luteireticuli TaxID=173858 RepID=UPI003558E5A7